MTGRGPLAGSPIDGQLTFSSGWEWGYWPQEVVTARASWDPHVEITDEDEALRVALAPVVRPFSIVAPQISEILVEHMHAQHELLIEGRIDGNPPAEIVRRNGQAYMQGFEPFDDVGDLADDLPGVPLTMTQPARLGLVEMLNPLHAPPPYSSQLEPLLAEMETRFTATADALEALHPMICYLNIIDPVLVGYDEGSLTDAAGVLADVVEVVPGLGAVAECLTVPDGGPPLPPPGVRD